MAVSALNMTPYFAGYPFQGKHRRRSITNYLNYETTKRPKSLSLSRWYRRKSARSSSWSRFRRVASKTRDHYPLTQPSPPPLLVPFSAIRSVCPAIMISFLTYWLWSQLAAATTFQTLQTFWRALSPVSSGSLLSASASAICTRGWGCDWSWCCGGSAALILAQRLLFGVLCIT